MPAYHVTVAVTFQVAGDQLAVEAAKTAIESMTRTNVNQTSANTEADVKQWVAQQINALPLVSGNGIIVTPTDITLNNFQAAVAGNESNHTGTNGSYTFTVALKKGGSTTVTTTSINGLITAYNYIAPLYSVYVSTTSHGDVSSDRDYAEAGKTITLTIDPEQGFELESLTTNPSVAMTGSGMTRTFIMPSNYVIINAKFKKTQAQLEKEAVESAQSAIESGAYRIAQSTGNTSPDVNSWLVNTLGVMLDDTGISPEESVISTVTILSLTPAVTGTATTPSGTNGDFTFTVYLKIGSTLLATNPVNGTIIAMPYQNTPLKQVEILQLSDLTMRILNTGNVETGTLKIELTGVNADAFWLPVSSINSLTVGGETDIVLSLRYGLDLGAYKANIVVSGENLPSTSFEITYKVTVTGNEALQAKPLRAWMQNGILHIEGLNIGQPWNVYTISGFLLHRSIATGESAKIPLPTRGLYILTSDTNTLKITF